MIECTHCGGTGRVHTHAGREFRRIRDAAGVDLRSLAKRLDVSYSSISRWEQGQRPWPHGLTGAYLRGVRDLARNG